MRQGGLTLAALKRECGDAELLNTEIGETAVGGCTLGGGERISRAFRKPLCRGDGARWASVAACVVDFLPLCMQCQNRSRMIEPQIITKCTRLGFALGRFA